MIFWKSFKNRPKTDLAKLNRSEKEGISFFGLLEKSVSQNRIFQSDTKDVSNRSESMKNKLYAEFTPKTWFVHNIWQLLHIVTLFALLGQDLAPKISKNRQCCVLKLLCPSSRSELEKIWKQQRNITEPISRGTFSCTCRTRFW